MKYYLHVEKPVYLSLYDEKAREWITCGYRIFSNLIRTLFTVLEG